MHKFIIPTSIIGKVNIPDEPISLGFRLDMSSVKSMPGSTLAEDRNFGMNWLEVLDSNVCHVETLVYKWVAGSAKKLTLLMTSRVSK